MRLDKSGAVEVDEYLCTNVPSIWALGDVINRLQVRIILSFCSSKSGCMFSVELAEWGT